MSVVTPVADVTQVAALSGAATALIAAAASLFNLRITMIRERPALSSFTREWASGPEGSEHYIQVCVANIAPRPISVVSMGVNLKCGDRTWRVSSGDTTHDLPARLEDGETVAMTWLRDELGREFYEGEAAIVRDRRPGTRSTGQAPWSWKTVMRSRNPPHLDSTRDNSR